MPEDENPASAWVPGCVERDVDLPGLRMHCVMAGPEDGQPVILLHGFPEFWYSWRFQIVALARAGYRVIAPDQRGYNLSGKAGPYDLATLTGDVAHLQDALGVSASHVMGHDWGGAVAWAFAVVFPRRVDRLVIMNAPHINAYMDALKRHPKQILKSWYVYVFQLPHLPEWSIRRDDYAALDRMFSQVASGRMTPKDVQRYKDACAQPGALAAMLGWYRALMRSVVTNRIPVMHVAAPTCVIWGERDVALEKGCNETLRRYVRDLRLHYLPDASHWVQMDEPDEVNRLMLDFLGSASSSR